MELPGKVTRYKFEFMNPDSEHSESIVCEKEELIKYIENPKIAFDEFTTKADAVSAKAGSTVKTKFVLAILNGSDLVVQEDIAMDIFVQISKITNPLKYVLRPVFNLMDIMDIDIDVLSALEKENSNATRETISSVEKKDENTIAIVVNKTEKGPDFSKIEDPEPTSTGVAPKFTKKVEAESEEQSSDKE